MITEEAETKCGETLALLLGLKQNAMGLSRTIRRYVEEELGGKFVSNEECTP